MSMIGKSLVHYEITSQLGKGGMGEVYQAKDSKLGRDVAIKILPEEFARDADRVARFQREAKLLASLNHPNIAAIYGLEESDGTNFLVMELIEGNTLADRIKTGPIPVEDALKLALQIAEALEAAHEKGVVHRDLKPANIKITPEGKIKVLDFGLAKALAEEQVDVNSPDSPTLSEFATRQGIILGTAAYMSPEQAKGKAVDRRTDIWAFGIVLYEMLTGRQLFASETVLDTLAAILRKEPNWEKVPVGVRSLLRRCLQKDSIKRLRDIGYLKLELEEILRNTSDSLLQPLTAVECRTKLRMILPWVAAAVFLTAIITGVAVWRLNPPEPSQVIRYDYELPEGQQFSFLGNQALAVSRDGRKLVYSTDNGLYLRSLDEFTSKLIAGTEERVYAPFFSPDGKWIGYFSDTDQKFKKITVSGGLPLALCGAQNVTGASWDKDGTIVFSQAARDITRISGDKGNPQSIVKWQSGQFRCPQILPDGKSILYTYSPSSSPPKIMVQSLKSGDSRELATGLDARYISTGNLIYQSPNRKDVFAVRFDPAALRIMSEPVLILEGVNQFAVSASGTLVYIPETLVPANSGRTLVWVDREGKEEPLSAEPNDYTDIRISPDGERIALQVSSPAANIYVWDIVRENMMRLTLDEGTNSTNPLWTSDGKRILFTTYYGTAELGDLYWKASDGMGKAEKLASSPGRGLYPNSWSKDGETLVLWEVTRDTGYDFDIGTLSMEGDHIRKALLQEQYWEYYPRVSPDGRWMAYTSNESGRLEVYICPFPDVKKGSKWKVSSNGGNCAIWSPDGQELYYQNENAIMAVPIETGAECKPGKPTVLFRGTLGKIISSSSFDISFLTYWDISPKDGRFLMLKDPGAEVPRKINIVLNWFEELKKRVPVK